MFKKNSLLSNIVYWLSASSIVMFVTMIVSIQYAYGIDFPSEHRNFAFDIIICPFSIFCLCVSLYEVFDLWYKNCNIKSVKLFYKVPFMDSGVKTFTPFGAFLLIIISFLPCLTFNFLSINYESLYGYVAYVIYSSGYVFVRMFGTIYKRFWFLNESQYVLN